MFKFRIDGIPLELHRSDEDVFRIINTDSGEVSEYRSEREAIVTYFGKLENALLQRGFLPSDFSEDCADEEQADAYDGENIEVPGFIDRTKEAKDIEKRFEEIKNAAGRNKEIKLDDAETRTYLALVDLYSLFYSNLIDRDRASRLMMKLKSDFYNEQREKKLFSEIFKRQQEEIKRSGNVLRFINENLETAPAEKLLEAAIDYICMQRGDRVTPEIMKRRIENAD